MEMKIWKNLGKYIEIWKTEKPRIFRIYPNIITPNRWVTLSVASALNIAFGTGMRFSAVDTCYSRHSMYHQENDK